MKNLLTVAFVFMLIAALFGGAQKTNADLSADRKQAWIQSVLREKDSSINSTDYIFYCTGHHGIIWSLITSDSGTFHIYNGTTRHYHDTVDQSYLTDTLSFIENNIRIITWGLDSLACSAQLILPSNAESYSPIYDELYVVKDGNIVFNYNNREDIYAGSDSIQFNKKLRSLSFLMLWLAAPSLRNYMPIPNDKEFIE